MSLDMNMRNQGFVKLEGFFRNDIIDSIRQEIEDIFNIFKSTQGKRLEQIAFPLFKENFEHYLGCCNAAQRLPSLWHLYSDYRLIRALRDFGMKVPTFSTPPLLNFSSRYTAKNEYNWKLAAHQDWPSNQGSINGMTIWIPLVNVPKNMGALNVIPGSHLHGCLPHEPTGASILLDSPKGGWRSIEMKQGDVLIMDPFLIHRAGTNVTKKIRLSCAARFNDITEPSYIARGYPKAPPFEARATEWPNKLELQDLRATIGRLPS